MPYLRFTRDRRGYENTFVVRTVQHRGRQQARVLYWFRSPPQVKVGRAALDETAIRELEATHPEIDFAWQRMLQSRPQEPEEEAGAEPDRRRELRGPRGQDGARTSRRRPGREREGALPTGDPKAEPGRRAEAPRDWCDTPAMAPSAAQQQLGAEELARLRGRYAAVQARISQLAAGEGGEVPAPDPAAIDALRALAEKLDPDAWVTPGEVEAGVANFGRVLGELRRQTGWPRRRSRGGRKHRTPGLTPGADASPPDDIDESSS